MLLQTSGYVLSTAYGSGVWILACSLNCTWSPMPYFFLQQPFFLSKPFSFFSPPVNQPSNDIMMCLSVC